MAGSVQESFILALLDEEEATFALLSTRERALVRYADIVTLRPASVRRSDLDELRAEGLDDLGIHDACTIIAYFAFVNRIADGLGVEIEHGDA